MREPGFADASYHPPRDGQESCLSDGRFRCAPAETQFVMKTEVMTGKHGLLLAGVTAPVSARVTMPSGLAQLPPGLRGAGIVQ